MDEVKVVYIGQDVSEYLKLSARHYFKAIRKALFPATMFGAEH